ncbi:MAG: outer membrane beta-barrel family protein [Ferruginibacter sp.]
MIIQQRFILLIFCSLFAAALHAQQNNGTKISGKIYLTGNTAAKNATVYLLRQQDSATVKIAVPDEHGLFEFEHITPGNYILNVTHTGYTNYYSDAFSLDEKNSMVTVPDIALKTATTTMAEVTIATKKPFIERKIDRLVVNVESSIVSTGSTLLEVLERSPGVMVNQESGLNLKGKSGVTVMIDGKPSPLSGADLLIYLKTVPSSSIERIDIITNPSAKYDASGNAGIIDIRFKKDKRQGYNGTFGLSYGQGVYAKPSVNLSLNVRRKQWNYFMSGAFASPKNLTNFYINRKFFKDGNGPVESVFDQKSFTRQPQKSYNFRTGVDWYAGSKTIIGVLMSTNFYKGIRDGLSNAVITDPDGLLQFKNITSNYLKDKRSSLLGNINLKHTFDTTGKELNADIDMGRFSARPLQDININTYGNSFASPNSSMQKSDQQSVITIRSFKADYVHPLKGKAKLEAGIKTSFVTTDNDVKFYTVVDGKDELDINRSNHFIYTENVNAAYINYSGEFKHTGLQAGLRMEHTHSQGDQVTTSQNLNRNYVQLFPSFFLTQQLNDNNELSLNYSRRIDRPTYRQLNPFKLLVDNYTYVLGDPYLLPVLTHSLQFGYTYKSLYNITLGYTQSRDEITDVFVQDDSTKISSQIPANMDRSAQYSVSVNIPVTIGKWFNSNINSSIYHNTYTSRLQGGLLKNNFTSWDVNVTNSFVIGKKGWTAELSGFYQSKSAWGQFIIRNLAQVSAGIQKTSANKKSVYKVAVADIFSTNHIAVIVKYQNQDWFTDRTWDSRFVTLSYSYRFGKNSVPKIRQRTGGVEDEKKRAGS